MNFVGWLGTKLVQLVKRVALRQLRDSGGNALMLWSEDDSVGGLDTRLLNTGAKCGGQCADGGVGN